VKIAPTKNHQAILIQQLPGPDRKRQPSLYHFRLTYRNPERNQPGCQMTWAVSGGRMSYQIALEQTEGGERRWHCSCADAVYRGGVDVRHVCKHVDGLRQFLPV
jgi:hypothetical protein